MPLITCSATRRFPFRQLLIENYVLKEQDDRAEVEAEGDDDRNRKQEVSDNPGRSALLAALNEDSP